ncbi:MAG TPA: hypothetical protein VJH03_23480 [Blastocatellia bacterium]|nr:hypothetical protein [Blastocatellia bacterium]
MTTSTIESAMQDDLVARGQQLYDDRLKARLEPEHVGRFAAIEPDFGKHFLGDTAIEALHAARKEMPEKLFYLVRIGHRAAYKIGGCWFSYDRAASMMSEIAAGSVASVNLIS